MSALADLKALCQILTDGGLPTHYDPPRVHTPGAWLALETVDGVNIDGSTKYTFALWLVAPATDVPRALEILDGLLTTAREILGGAITHYELGESITLPDGSTCPAFQLTINPH